MKFSKSEIKKRIAIIIRENIKYGAPVILNLAEIMAQAGFKVHVYNPADEETINMNKERNFYLHKIQLIFKNKLSNIEFWIKCFLKCLKFPLIIAVNSQGFVPSWLIKKIKRKTILIWYTLDFNGDWDNPNSYSVKFSNNHAKDCDLIVDVEINRALIRKKILSLIREPLVIVNAPRLNYIYNKRITSTKYKKNIVLLYQGEIGPLQGLDYIIRGFSLTKSQVILYLCGYGKDLYKRYLEDLVIELKIKEKIIWLPPRDREKLKYLTRMVDIGIVFYPYKKLNNPNLLYCAPSKLFDYMAAGVPVICSDNPSLKKWVENEGWGICVNVENLDEISNAIDYLARNELLRKQMSSRAIELFQKYYNLDIQSKPLITFIKNIFENKKY